MEKKEFKAHFNFTWTTTDQVFHFINFVLQINLNTLNRSVQLLIASQTVWIENPIYCTILRFLWVLFRYANLHYNFIIHQSQNCFFSIFNRGSCKSSWCKWRKVSQDSLSGHQIKRPIWFHPKDNSARCAWVKMYLIKMRHYLRQYMPNKPQNWDDPSGFAYRFEIYNGASLQTIVFMMCSE